MLGQLKSNQNKLSRLEMESGKDKRTYLLTWYRDVVQRKALELKRPGGKNNKFFDLS